MEAVLSSDKSLSTVISLLRDSTAAEELTLDEVNSHHYTLASPDSQNFISEVPSLLSQIGDFLKSLVTLTKDVLENGSFLVKNAREEKSEKLKSKQTAADNASSGVSFDDLTAASASQGWLGRLLSVGAFLIGTIVGVVTELSVFIKNAFKGTFIESLALKITSPIKNAYGKIGKGISMLFEFVNAKFLTVFDGIKQSRFMKMFSGLGESFSMIGKGFQFLFKGSGSDLMKGLTKFIEPILTFFKFGKALGSALTKFLGKIAIPLTIIIGLWDTITGAIAGYKTEGITGAIKGGISGLLNSLVGSILDLIKDAASWVIGALGFKDAAAMLDSFSFSKLISDGVTAIVDTVSYFFEYLASEFSVSKFIDAFDNFGILGIVSIISGGILDMMKGAASWILTMFGATDWAVALDGFSFQDLYKQILNKMKKFFTDAVSKFASLAINVKEMTDALTKTILKNTLPRPDPNSSWYSPQNLAASAIPNSIYEYAGIDPKTGQLSTTLENNQSKIISVNPADTASMVSTSTDTRSTTIVNNISRGGDVNNMSNSNVNNNVNGASSPIITGSAMGLYAF
jgi:hypothetical protein